MNGRICLQLGAGLGGLAVMLGAFGAHGLKERLAPAMLDVFEVGVRYHFYHALALVALAFSPASGWQSSRVRAVAWCWLGGVLVFSGSLYVLALTGLTKFGMITPIGGLAFIAGWILLLLAARPLLHQD